jgi:predicted ribonuclease toxin of YeeF-YezG toxin-antitoxin module
MKKLLLTATILLSAFFVNAQEKDYEKIKMELMKSMIKNTEERIMQLEEIKNNNFRLQSNSYNILYSTPYYHHTQTVRQGIQYRNSINSIRSSYRIR